MASGTEESDAPPWFNNQQLMVISRIAPSPAGGGPKPKSEAEKLTSEPNVIAIGKQRQSGRDVMQRC